MHPVQRRFWAENLVRRRRSDEQQRYAASQRRGRIDPNPHQIDAVVFALRRIPEGGCILADEVGLGKTIEAGLVIAQLLAEGARRILILLPKPLMGQWQNELFSLFGVDTREVTLDPESVDGDGVFVAGREFAGSQRGASLLASTNPFDLCIIDEAHEIFAGIYKRYRRDGTYEADSDEAKLAARVRSFLGPTPVLLLTATPIQNTLSELWGLVQYVEPTGTLLGSLGTFRDVFCEPGNERALAEGQGAELRQRINRVVQRTLRRQAQEFLERPFTKRRARLFEYSMSPAERQLYEDVTNYLLEPDLAAFSGNGRRLLLISFHRLMASSIPALAKSLDGVAQRLRTQLKTLEAEEGAQAEAPRDATQQLAGTLATDLEDEELTDEFDELTGVTPDPEQRKTSSDNDPPDPPPAPVALDSHKVRIELERVEQFATRARALGTDSKAERLKQAVALVLSRAERGEGSGKVVIFTESLTTQAYLQDLLVDSGLGLDDRDITLFRGTNDSQRAAEALANWQQEVGEHLPPASRPSRDVAMRLALVHEFRTRSRVFISTEAGAKGLNLQFCETLINFDLPWNPQRIEQRIGRCHRYSQERDVTVINFISKENEAQRLTFQILSQKLDLFGEVLDASDVVLHEPTADAPESLATALGADFENQLRRIYERARNQEELAHELQELSDSMAHDRKVFEETQQRMTGLIQTRFDDSVRNVFRQLADELPQSLAEIDHEMDRVLIAWLEAEQLNFTREVDEQGRVLITLAPDPKLPPGYEEGGQFVIGEARDTPDHVPIHLGHPLLDLAVEESRQATAELTHMKVRRAELPKLSSELPTNPTLARLLLIRIRHDGFEPFERIEPLVVSSGADDPWPQSDAMALIDANLQPTSEEPDSDNEPNIGEMVTSSNHSSAPAVDEELIEDILDDMLFDLQSQVVELEQQRFEQAISQIEQFAEDQLLVQRREHEKLSQRLEDLQTKRAGAIGPDRRQRLDSQAQNVEKQLELVSRRIELLENRQDDDYRRWRDRAHEKRYARPELERLVDVTLEIE